SADGNATLILAAILLFMLQPCVPVAAMVVSEITERLSPNIAPPKTVPATSGRSKPDASEMPMAMGTIVEMVPIEVPMEKDTKHEIKNRPGKSKRSGKMKMPRLTAASTEPAA